MPWQTTISMFSSLIALIALLIFLRSSRHAKRVAIKEATDLIFRDWWSEELRRLRGYFFYDFLPNGRAKLIGKGMKEIDRVIPGDEGRTTKFCYFFDRVGWLGAAGLIDVDYVLGPMQHTMRRTWIVMEPLIAKERELQADKMLDPVFQYGFEWLFKRSNKCRKHQVNLLRYRFHRPGIWTRRKLRAFKKQIDIDENNFRQKLEEILHREKPRFNKEVIMEKCSQCGKPAIVRVGANYLCVDCNLKFEQAQLLEHYRDVTMLNFLTAQAESVIGIPGVLPRYEVLRPVIYQGTTSFNNIKVDNSVVGSINTGQVRQIDVAMDNIKIAGNEQLASLLKEFTEAVLAEKQLTAELRNELVEQLSFISSQCVLRKEARKPTIVRSILKRIEEIVTTVKSLAAIWAPLSAILQSIFG